jgi:hypothetical protein
VSDDRVVDESALDISVVIPCYNAARWLPMQLESLSKQDYSGSWEVILADNGSTDASVMVARAFADRFSSFKVIDASAIRGSSFAYNTGAAMARGRVVAFCDADDVVGSGWLAAMATALKTHPIVAGPFEIGELNEPWATRGRKMPQQDGLQGLDSPPFIPHAGSGNLGFNREAWVGSGGFAVDMPVFGDTDLCWRVFQRGYNIYFEPGAVVHIRLRTTLWQMWRQAYSYGCALAELHTRHGLNGSSSVPTAGVGRRRQFIARAWLLSLPLRAWNKGGLARLLWEYGWRAGRLAGHHRFPSADRSPAVGGTFAGAGRFATGLEYASESSASSRRDDRDCHCLSHLRR